MSAPEGTDEARARQRLFFALWPDERVRAALAELARQHAQRNGRAVAADNLHITLAFIGGVTAAQRDCMASAAATVIAAPFSVTLDSLGYWPRPRVVWAGAGCVPDALTALVSALNTVLEPCGYRPDERPYKTHVTLVRKARHAPAEERIAPLVWRADAFCLVESVTGEQGAEYRVIARWPLRGCAV